MTTPPTAGDTGRNGPWLTRSQAADRLQVSTDTIDRAIRNGDLRARRIGTVVRLHIDDVDRFGGPTT